VKEGSIVLAPPLLETTLITESHSRAKAEPLVSIIMPMYNERDKAVFFVKMALERYSSQFRGFELIIVDDGSVDGTREALGQIKDDRVKVVGYPRNEGKGAALLYGFHFAAGERVIFDDADLQASPKEVKRYLNALEDADIVVASKRIRGAQVDAVPKRKFLSLAFNLFVKILLPLSVSDTQAGFKAFRRTTLERIVPSILVKRYAFDVELLVVARLLNLEITEIPAQVTLSSEFEMRHILRMMVDLLGIAYRLRLRHWYQDNISARNTMPYEPILRW
jgi:glycosyltransferase involved in cell wall biosynthesis